MRSPRTATKSSPHSPQLEKACAQQRRPNAAKKKKKDLLENCNIWRRGAINLAGSTMWLRLPFINSSGSFPYPGWSMRLIPPDHSLQNLSAFEQLSLNTTPTWQNLPSGSSLCSSRRAAAFSLSQTHHHHLSWIAQVCHAWDQSDLQYSEWRWRTVARTEAWGIPTSRHQEKRWIRSGVSSETGRKHPGRMLQVSQWRWTLRRDIRLSRMVSADDCNMSSLSRETGQTLTAVGKIENKSRLTDNLV